MAHFFSTSLRDQNWSSFLSTIWIQKQIYTNRKFQISESDCNMNCYHYLNLFLAFLGNWAKSSCKHDATLCPKIRGHRVYGASILVVELPGKKKSKSILDYFLHEPYQFEEDIQGHQLKYCWHVSIRIEREKSFQWPFTLYPPFQTF